MMLAMLAVLCGLGVWQIHRLHWKRGILAAIDHAEASPPIPLPPHPSQFQKVDVTGTLRPDLSVHYLADVRDTPQGAQMGSQLIQPLIRKDGPPIMVMRGWVPETQGTTPASLTPVGQTTIAGYIRIPDRPGPFTPKDDPAHRIFYTLDPLAMAAALNLRPITPYTLVVLGTARDGVYPIPATALPRPPNDHLSYAITWFGLAFVLLVMFASWARTALQNREA